MVCCSTVLIAKCSLIELSGGRPQVIPWRAKGPRHQDQLPSLGSVHGYRYCEADRPWHSKSHVEAGEHGQKLVRISYMHNEYFTDTEFCRSPTADTTPSVKSNSRKRGKPTDDGDACGTKAKVPKAGKSTKRTAENKGKEERDEAQETQASYDSSAESWLA